VSKQQEVEEVVEEEEEAEEEEEEEASQTAVRFQLSCSKKIFDYASRQQPYYKTFLPVLEAAIAQLP
jgi:hypothetical protein